MTNGRVWCSREAKLFAVNVEKIAVRPYFYRAEPLDPTEEVLLSSFISRVHPSAHKTLSNALSFYKRAYTGSEFARKNTIEKYHSNVERTAIHLLDCVYREDLTFWDNEISRTAFSYFTGMQYTRTEKSQESSVAAFDLLKDHPGNPGNIDPRKLSKVISLFYADMIGNWLFSLSTPKIITNDLSTALLTSDQPVYNVHTRTPDEVDPIRNMELYYPVTPDKALLFTAKPLSECNVDLKRYNEFIVSNAQQYIFAKSERDLLPYVPGLEGKSIT